MAGAFGYDLLLYHFGAVPSVMYSDMNGYGHFLRARALVPALLGGGERAAAGGRTALLGARRRYGLERARAHREGTLDAARSGSPRPGRRRCSSPRGPGSSTTPTCSIPIARSSSRRSAGPSTRRRTSRSSPGPQPKVVAVRVDVDLFPASTACASGERYTLKNKSDGGDPGALRQHLRAGPGAQARRERADAARRIAPRAAMAALRARAAPRARART